MLVVLLFMFFAAQPSHAQQPATAAAPIPNTGPVHENIAYGAPGGPTLLLDIFEPAAEAGSRPRPAVILIHGGGWTSFDKSTMRALAQFLASSAKYNVDPHRIGAYGHSAGGQLALMLGMLETRDNSDRALAKYSSKVEAVVDASGPTDLTTHQSDEDDMKFLAAFLGADYASHPDVWREASPVFHAAKSNAPILIIHGTRDEMVPIAQAEELNDALTKAGGNVKFLRLDSDHMFHEPLAHRQLALETQAFFERYLAPAP